MTGSTDFRTRYGPWALVAGASEGLGAAFAAALASRGCDLVLVARRQAPLSATAERLRAAHGVRVRALALDLGRDEHLERLLDETSTLDLGSLLYNAAASRIGAFLDGDVAEHLRELDVNCRAPLKLAHGIGSRLAARGRGGVVLISSLAGFVGSPLVAHYAATKAWSIALGEALWEELGASGVDVLVSVVGMTRTPRFEASRPRPAGRLAPAVLEPEAVAEESLASLGRRPLVVVGRGNRWAAFWMRRLLPRRAAVRAMGGATRRVYPQHSERPVPPAASEPAPAETDNTRPDRQHET